jgi:hypothetical protein
MSMNQRDMQDAAMAGVMGKARESTPAAMSFDPAGIYYDATTGRYLVDIGSHYRAYSRKSPVAEGVRRFHAAAGLAQDDAKQEAAASLHAVEIDNAVDWSGCIAGFKRGVHRKDGLSLLVTSEAELADPVPGPCPIINRLIREAFPEHTERIVFIGWLSGAVKAVRSGMHAPAPMLVLAGAVNTGKSLLSWMVAQILGGRVGHPFIAWSGTLPWNDNIVGSELLLIDDSVSSTDIRTRREFGARFKEAIYGDSVELRKRNVSAISLRPVWRVLVCCNDTPEALAIIPPLDDDLDDKISMLRVHPIKPPVDTSDADGKREFQRMIRAELPAFMSQLMSFEIPADMKDSRSGMKAWRDPDLVEAIDGLTPERRLEGLIRVAMDQSWIGIIPGNTRRMTASEIEGLLCDSGSPVRDQARTLLSKFDAACGRYLGKLSKRSEIVAKGTVIDGIQRWDITRPGIDAGSGEVGHVSI